MPGKDAQRWIISYAAIVLTSSELPVPLEEIFLPAMGPNGPKSLGRKFQRAIMDRMLRRGYVSVRRINGVDHYEIGSAYHDFILSLPTRDEIPELENALGISVESIVQKRHSAKVSERRGKATVALNALKKILSSQAPQTRNALFKPHKGDKWEERAAWTPTWQISFLNAAVAVGAVVAVPGNPTKYEVGDRQLLTDIVNGKSVGPTCLITMLWPEEPCTVDHSKGDIMEDVARSVKKPSIRSDSVGDGPGSSKPMDSVEPGEKTESVKPDGVELKPPSGVSESDPVLVTLTSVLKLLKSQSSSHELVLAGMTAMAQRVSALTDEIKGLKDAPGYASIRSELASLKKRIGFIEEGQRSVRDAIAELRAALAKSASVSGPDDTARALEALRSDVAKALRTAKRSSILERLESVAGDIEALRDLALDSISKGSSAVDSMMDEFGAERGVSLEAVGLRSA